LVWGKYFSSRSFSDNLPASRSAMTNTAVNVLVIDPIMYCVSSFGAVIGSSRAAPTCIDHTSVPSLTTPTLTAGECH